VSEVPGSPGAAGTNGTDGINAFSTVQAQFTVPAINSSVSITVDFNQWVVVGQYIFIFGAGTFLVNSLAGTTVIGATYSNFTQNTHAGAVIAVGSQISPSGDEPTLTGFAHSGANSDITSLTGLTTPLTRAQGGTGFNAASITALLTDLTVQAASKILAAGTATVNTPNITANSIVLISLATPGGTRTGFAGYKITSLTPGTPGSFIITAIDDSGATLGSCTDTVNWHVIL
jgi:hypothetical protein